MSRSTKEAEMGFPSFQYAVYYLRVTDVHHVVSVIKINNLHFLTYFIHRKSRDFLSSHRSEWNVRQTSNVSGNYKLSRIFQFLSPFEIKHFECIFNICLIPGLYMQFQAFINYARTAVMSTVSSKIFYSRFFVELHTKTGQVSSRIKTSQFCKFTLTF
jgi:hypothetical protein